MKLEKKISKFKDTQVGRLGDTAVIGQEIFWSHLNDFRNAVQVTYKKLLYSKYSDI